MKDRKFLLLFITIFLDLFGFGIVIPVLPSYIKNLAGGDGKDWVVGIIIACFSVAQFFSTPLLGGLSDRLGRRPILLWTLLGNCIGYFTLAIATTLLPFKEFVKVFETPFFGRIFIISFIFVTGFFLFQIPSPLLWKEHFHLDEEHIGYLFGIVGISTSVVQAGLVGPIKKLLGEKNMLIFGNIIQGVTICAVPFIPIDAFWVLMPTCLFFQSLGNGMLNPALMSYLSQNTEPQHQGRMFGLYQSFGSLARIVGPVLGATLYGLHYIVPYATALVLFVLNTLLSLGIGSILSKYLLKKNQLDSEEIIQTENVYS